MTRVLAVACLCCAAILAAGPSVAAEQPVVTLTPAQEAKMKGTYYNCDREGAFGCLRLSCAARNPDRAEVQYLYREVAESFPEFLTPALRACFIRAGGRFR